MSTENTLGLSLHRLPEWLLRVASDPVIGYKITQKAMIFANWYSLCGNLLQWPEPVEALATEQRNKRMSLDRALSLLAKLGYDAKGHSSLEQARTVLEGYEVHDWVVRNPEQFMKMAQERLAYFKILSGQLTEHIGSYTPLSELGKVLNLQPLEKQVLEFSLTCAVIQELQQLCQQLSRATGMRSTHLWCTLFDCTADNLATVMAPRSTLRTCGLLQTSGDEVRLPVLPKVWIAILADDRPLFNTLLTPLEVKPSSGMPARLTPEDQLLAVDVLKNAREPGVNLLLYGASTLEKRQVLAQLVSQAGSTAYRVCDFDKWEFQPSMVYVAQRVLHKALGTAAVLIIENASTVLERQPPAFLAEMFGLKEVAGHIAPFDELILATNPGTCIWISDGAGSLNEECIGRFVFHAKLQKARREERRQQLETKLNSLKLTLKTSKEILQLEDVSALQLETGLRAAKLGGARSPKAREAALLQALKRSLQALDRNTAPKAKECVTDYSLKYINTSGRFGPTEILRALKQRPKGTLCLYGPPGTGKTQFVEHLASTLGMPLISRTASDLLSKWVGDSEKNIAAMFAEAEGEEALLFLDEADSFLRDRSTAQASWEVTRVNELLQHMERFPGIFVVATNLFKNLDTAALRRFTFKMEFCALAPDQRWEMFINETGIKDKLSTLSETKRENWYNELVFMQQLAPGDFATVKRQCILLGETLSPAEWIKQLQLECAVKSAQAKTPTMG